MRTRSNLATGLLAGCLLCAVSATPLSAEGAKGDECAAKVRDFVRDLDYVMARKQRSKIPLQNTLQKYFPTDGCRVDEVIAIARQSKYFWDTYETISNIAAHFRNDIFTAGFGVDRKSGNIDLPYVSWRVPF